MTRSPRSIELFYFCVYNNGLWIPGKRLYPRQLKGIWKDTALKLKEGVSLKNICPG